MQKHKVILDCDNTMGLLNWEVDDGLLLLYLLGREDMDLLGITNTFGNSTHANVAKYTKRMLVELNRQDIPRFDGECYSGQNPLINVDRASGPRYVNEDVQAQPITPAARFLAEQAAQYPGEIIILAAGPLSNLYKASLVDPNFFKNIKQVICMGGYVGDLYLGGRLLPELNFACDPVATHTVIHSGTPMVIMTGQVCLDAPFRKKDMERLPAWNAQRIQVVADWLRTFSSAFSIDAFYLWDLLIPIYISYPELFDDTQLWINPSVEDLKRGLLPEGDPQHGVLVTMPRHIRDYERFMDILFEAWHNECEKEHEWTGIKK
jgi:purine nucleosidase